MHRNEGEARIRQSYVISTALWGQECPWMYDDQILSAKVHQNCHQMPSIYIIFENRPVNPAIHTLDL